MSTKISRRFVIALVGVLLVALGSGGGVYYCCFYHPMGEGPAGPEVNAQAFDTVWSSRPVLLVGLGDSITCGWSACPPGPTASNCCVGITK